MTTLLNLADLTPWYLTRLELGLDDTLPLAETSECQGCGIPVLIRRESDPHWCRPCLSRHLRGYEASKARAESLGTRLAFGRARRHPLWWWIEAPRGWA